MATSKIIFGAGEDSDRMDDSEAPPAATDDYARQGDRLAPNLEWHETMQASKPGNRVVRLGTHTGITRVRRGHLVPRPGTGAPTTRFGRNFKFVSHARFSNMSYHMAVKPAPAT